MYISCLLNITSAFFDVYYSPLSLIVLTFDAIHGFVEAAWLAVSVRANCNAVEMRTQAIMPKLQIANYKILFRDVYIHFIFIMIALILQNL